LPLLLAAALVLLMLFCMLLLLEAVLLLLLVVVVVVLLLLASLSQPPTLLPLLLLAPSLPDPSSRSEPLLPQQVLPSVCFLPAAAATAPHSTPWHTPPVVFTALSVAATFAAAAAAAL
jgi:hypothetical protein